LKRGGRLRGVSICYEERNIMAGGHGSDSMKNNTREIHESKTVGQPILEKKKRQKRS